MVQFIRNREEFEQMVLVKKREGWSIRELSRYFQTSRNTIRRILRTHVQKREISTNRRNPKRLKRKSKLDPYLPFMREMIEKYPKITTVRMLEELRIQGYQGGKTILGDRMKEMKPCKQEKVEVRFETAPGRQGQMDWSEYTLKFRRTGKAKVYCFSYILAFSRRQYIDFTLDHRYHTLIRRHQDAFGYFGGVPAECLYDNEKTIVLRWEAGKPIYNPKFIDFITHYECTPIACRPGRPKTKGKIESTFRYIENNLLCAREFDDLQDLRNFSKYWLKNKSDHHINKSTGNPPLALFMEQEVSKLRPLPLHPYDTAEIALRVCRSDGFIEFETNLYSVPGGYVADIISLKATEEEVKIYNPNLSLIATHQRYPRGARKIQEDPSHRKSKTERYGLKPVEDKFLALGESAEPYLLGLKKNHPKNCGFHARFILGLKEDYECIDIEKALRHAMKYHAYEGKVIGRILKAKAKTRTLESIQKDNARKTLAENLPTIEQRSLEEYQQVLKKEENDKK